jgi:Calcineurin-like phosphoesterase
LLIPRFRKIGYIVGFSAIFLIFSSSLMSNNGNFLLAYPHVNKVSFDELNRYAIIPVKDKASDFRIPSFTSNPNLDVFQDILGDNNAGNNPGNNVGNNTGSMRNPWENREDKSNERMEKLKEKVEKSLSDNDKNGKSQSEYNEDNRGNDDDNENGKRESSDELDTYKDIQNTQLLEQQEENKVKDARNDNDNDDDNEKEQNTQLLEQQEENKVKDARNDRDDEKPGMSGLDLNIEQKQDKVNKKIEKLNEEQQEEGSDLRIQKIQANLEKQIEKLKDKFENDRDNQRLIEQRNEFDDDDDDDDGDIKDDDDDDGDSKDDDDGKNYDDYGFKGDNDNGKENGEENFNFAAAGDFGCSANTKNTIENMQSKEPEIVLTVGDHSYHSTADCWFDMASPIKDKLMITLGHHDVEDGQAKMNQFLNSFGMKKPFYSYEYNKVHFLVMSAKSVYYKGSEQYNFILEDLKKASENKDINWIVVSSYGPLYSSRSEHTAFEELRDVYHPIFEKYGVDLVLSGHNHNYQRTYPITYNPNNGKEPVVTSTATYDGQKDGIVPVATSERTAVYDGQKDGIVPVATSERTAVYDGQKDGIVFAIVGTGGVNLYSFNGQAPYVDTQFANKFGFLNIDISNGNPHTKLTGTFYDNKGDQVLDQFTIDKQIQNKKSEVNK